MTHKLTLTREQMEARRLLAGQMFQQGKGVREVSRLLGVAPSSVSRWKKAFGRGGFESLKASKAKGPKPRLTARQKERLVKLLLKGPVKAGFPNDLWTCPRVAQVIEKRFAVRYHPGHVWYLLRDLGWTCQMPEHEAREGDDEVLQRWRKKEWPRIKRKARRQGAHIVFLDETGFMLQPTRRRTWAPRGKTPIHKAWDRRERLSTIGSLTVSPRRRRLNLYFLIQSRNVEGPDLVYFVRQVRRHVGGGRLLLVWDRSGPHQWATKELLRQHSAWISVEYLPPYSPTLNPQEHCWDQTKYHDLPNFIPEDVEQLSKAASKSISKQRSNQALLKSHFEYAQLAL